MSRALLNNQFQLMQKSVLETSKLSLSHDFALPAISIFFFVPQLVHEIKSNR